MQITKNVVKLDCTKGSYSYAVLEKGNVTLIDTCFPGRGKAILKELEGIGIQPKMIKRILITHCDSDHIGNIAYLADKTGCDIFISKDDLPYTNNEKSFKGIRKLLGIFMKVKIPSSLSELSTSKFEKFDYLLTPGHTPGHMCFKYENILFAGDLVRSKDGQLIPSPSYFTWDKEKMITSCKTLDLTGIDWICPAHGEPVPSTPAWETFINKYIEKTN